MPETKLSREIHLKVTEAQAKDVGRGIARMDPKDMARLDLELGEIVAIEGKRCTVAKAMPCFPEDRGKGIVQIDGLIRDNAVAGLDDKVTVRKETVKPGQRIILAPLTISKVEPDRDTRYLGSLLTGIPLTEGDRIRAMVLGTKGREFKVVKTNPSGPIVIQSDTQIVMELKQEEEVPEGALRGMKISYEDIGGLEESLLKVRELIELPLRYPQLFERLGIDPPKGVFLHGPPGCGKTLIARAVANETNAYFTHISGPEIMGKFYGESEKKLRDIFEDAQRHAPSILFIDEIDAIAPKREEMGGEKQVERRVVAQLLALMDGIESRGQVIVIAATNIPNSIDPALRRPGRFDREIEIRIPDRKGRRQILEIHTRGMPLAKDVNLDELSEITHGFVGADLEALAREAAMTSLRHVLPSVDLEKEDIPFEVISQLEVTHENFFEALKDVSPSAIREVFLESPNVHWSDIGGLEEVKKLLKEAVQWPLKYEGIFFEAGLRPPKGILLSGPPGTGKTLIAKGLATESGVNFISIKGPELFNKFLGESERGVREIFRKAKNASPCFIFFDEIDSLIPRRGTGGGSDTTTDRVIGQFLTELDGIENIKGVLVLAATNRIDRVDPAMLRAGRFDRIIEIPKPDAEAREKIFQVHTKGKPLAGDMKHSLLAEKTEGMTGADIEAIVREATMSAVRRVIEEKEGPKGKDKNTKVQIHAADFLAAIEDHRANKPKRNHG